MSVYITPTEWLSDAAAGSYARMRAAGMPAGGITDAGRTYAEQQVMYARYLSGLLQATAARPGTSRHETGNALDMATVSDAHRWMVAHAGAHGWHRPLLSAAAPEPWHWEYRITHDQHLAAAPAPAPLTPQEDDIMATIEDLVQVLRSEGVSGAGDLGRLTRALDAPLRTIVTEQTTAVVRSEGVSGAGDLGRLVGAVVPAVVAALPTGPGAPPLTPEQITAAVETGVRNVLRTALED